MRKGQKHKLTLVSSFGLRADEGQRNIAEALLRELASHYDVVPLRPRLSPTGMAAGIFTFGSPDLVHTILRILPRTSLYIRLLRARAPRAKIVVSVLQPPINIGGRIGIPPLFCADGVICTSKSTARHFEGRFKIRIVPNGVDTARFRPVSDQRRKELREKYGLDSRRPVLLQVGQITAGRNLHALAHVAREVEGQALLVGGGTIAQNTNVLEGLESEGVKVITNYLIHIEEVYQLADLYLFPTTDSSFAVEMPLSVLEAVACGLPVVTADFPGLREHLDDHPGIVFAGSFAEMVDGTRKLLTTEQASTRRLVESYSWPCVAERVGAFYRELMNEES